MTNRYTHGCPRARLGRGATPRAGAMLMLAALAGVMAACDPDKLLDVDSPSRIPADILESPGNAQLMVNSAIADFECAAGAYFVVSGLIGEELKDGLQTADRYPYDQRSLTPADRRYQAFECQSIGTYLPLQTARASTDRVQRYLEQWTDAEVAPFNRSSGIAMMALLGGYSRIYLGEGFCSMAISSVFGTEITYGGEISRDSVFRQAETKFGQAIATASTDSVRLAAHLGRARARLNLGDFAGAKSDASQVVSGFAFNSSASSTNSRRENRIWAQNNPNTDATLVDELYVARNDPRIVVIPPPADGDSTVTGVPRYRQTKFPSASSPIPIARYDEAQLILAEAELEVGTVAQALIHLNNVRQPHRGAFVSVDPAAIRAEIIEERRRELFLEGHHLGDIVRYDIQLQPPPGTPYHGSGNYGTRTGTTACMPLPNNERLNNPAVPDNP